MITNRRKIYLEVLKRKKKTYKYVFAYLTTTREKPTQQQRPSTVKIR